MIHSLADCKIKVPESTLVWQYSVIAASGAFEVVLDDGMNKRTVILNRPFMGIHIPPEIWASEQGFSSGAICLVLTSEKYKAEDYIRDYNEFLNKKK